MKLSQNDLQRDALTGAFSRASIKEILQQEIDTVIREGGEVSVLLMDIDHFKSINDGFGHARGDEALVEFVRRLQHAARASDYVYRYGGDEFVVITPQAGKQPALALGIRLLDAVRSTPFDGDPPLSLSTSIGVSTCPQDGTTVEALLAVADERQYQAKRAGRGRVVSEDLSFPDTVLALEEPSRLLERDEALETLKRFLENLPERGRGILQVRGGLGSGRTRFLAEARNLAQLQQYAILDIRGKPALSNRYFGALIEALMYWTETGLSDPQLPQPVSGIDNFMAAVSQVLIQRHCTGLFITLDNPHSVDPATRDFIQSLLLFSGSETGDGRDRHQPFPLAVVYSEDNELEQPVLRGAPLQMGLSLLPLSADALRIWIRQCLQWEAPDRFIDWFYEITGGLPAFIQRGLAMLINKKLLIPGAGGWECIINFNESEQVEQAVKQAALPDNNLPVNITTFVGRETDLQLVKQLVRKQNLVILVGAGGQGKSRLAVQAAAESLEQFPGGVFYVALDAVHTLDILVQTIAHALRLNFSTSGDIHAQLLDYLQNKNMLLVLDGYEGMAYDSTLLSEIITQAPGVHLLVTSREQVALPNPTLIEVGGLPYPQVEKERKIEDYSAVQLFVRSARRALTVDGLIPEEDKPYVARICQLVEGSPLGIELAAAWSNVYTFREIAEHIEENMNLLGMGESQHLPGVASLMAVFDSFYGLMFEGERSTLRKLSVFQRGFDEQSAGAVAGASPFFLDALVTKYYLRRISDSRYQLHEVLRQYVGEKLRSANGEYASTQQCHSAHYLALLAEKGQSLAAGGQKAALAAINADIENIRAAWEWAVENKAWKNITLAIDPLFNYYYMRSWFREGQDMFTKLDDALNNLIATHSDAKLTHELAFLQGMTLCRRGWFTFLLGDYSLAEALFNQSLTLLREWGTAREVAFCLNYKGAVAYHLKDYDGAKILLEESRQICQHSTQNRLDESVVLNILGQVAEAQGDLKEARRCFSAAMQIKREAGDIWGSAFTLEYLGKIALMQAELDEAEALFRESLAVRRDMDDQRGIGMNLTQLGNVAYDQGRLDDARRLYNESHEVFRMIGNRLGIEQSVANLEKLNEQTS